MQYNDCYYAPLKNKQNDILNAIIKRLPIAQLVDLSFQGRLGSGGHADVIHAFQRQPLASDGTVQYVAGWDGDGDRDRDGDECMC
jgi:hypothetical protein